MWTFLSSSISHPPLDPVTAGGGCCRVLGVPHLTLAEKLASDPLTSHSWSLTVATRLSSLLQQLAPDKRFTFIVPTNGAWEKVRRDFSSVFASLTDLNNPDYVSVSARAANEPLKLNNH